MPRSDGHALLVLSFVIIVISSKVKVVIEVLGCVTGPLGGQVPAAALGKQYPQDLNCLKEQAHISINFFGLSTLPFHGYCNCGATYLPSDERAEGIIVCDSCKRPSRPAKVGNIQDARCPHCTRRPSLRFGRPSLRNRFRRRPRPPPSPHASAFSDTEPRPWPPRHVAPPVQFRTMQLT